MKMAQMQAHKSEEPNRHGCIIAKRRTIVGLGCNKGKTHPAAVKCYSGCIHAELAAVLSANTSKLVGADIFVCRVYKQDYNEIGLSRPCIHCMDLIRRSKIKQIYYTTADGKIKLEKV